MSKEILVVDDNSDIRLLISSILKRMADAIKHRGPDGKGLWMNNNVGIAHRRLSVIDLSTGENNIYETHSKYDDKYFALDETIRFINCYYVPHYYI